jgi:hypothetical protein
MSLNEFTESMAPYFMENIQNYLANNPGADAFHPEDLDGYARRLARDMYFSGKLFGVPMTFLVSIAHQETYFANVLGDRTMSASPFQITGPPSPSS